MNEYLKDKLIFVLFTLVKILLISFAILVLFSTTKSSGQIYYGDLTKEEYNKILSGNSFYPAKVLLHDGTTHEGFVARFPESNVIRFKETMDADRVYSLTERHVKAFKYGLEEYNYPTFVFINLDTRRNKTEIRAVEMVSNGDITIYQYTWIELPDVPWLPFSGSNYTLNLQFYLKKDDELYRIDDFRKEIVTLIKDKEEVFIEYKRQKIKKTNDYKPFIRIIKLYNETE